MRKIKSNEIKTIIDGLLSGAKGICEKPVKLIDADGCIIMNPEARELLNKRDGYFFLLPGFVKTKDGDFLIAYYLKLSEYPKGPFSPMVDDNHRVYCFLYKHNKKTDSLTLTHSSIRLSAGNSIDIIDDWVEKIQVIEDSAATKDWARYLIAMAGIYSSGVFQGATVMAAYKKHFPDDFNKFAKDFGGEKQLFDIFDKRMEGRES